MKATELVSPREPPYLLKAARTSAAVRLRLSVRVSTINATPPGPYPSYRTSSKFSASPSAPDARLIARSIRSLGIFAPRAAWIAALRAGFPEGSGPPPVLTATIISRPMRVNILARFAS